MYTNVWRSRKDCTITSQKIANKLNSEHIGEDIALTGFASLSNASQSDLSFCKEGYEFALSDTNAGAIITTEPCEPDGFSVIYSEAPKSDFIHISHEYFLSSIEWSVHESAQISPDAKIGEDVLIGPNVVIGEDVTIGDKCVIGSGTTIGQPGYGYQPRIDGQTTNMHHEGSIVIEDEVHIGANCTVDRAVEDVTAIKCGTKIHHMVHVAHNAEIGEHNRINQFCSISGSVTTGSRVRMHPHSVISSQTAVGEGATIGANSTVLSDVPPGCLVVGSPASPVEE